MNEVWDLSILYKDFDDPALEPYRFLLESIRRDSKYLLTDREEELA